jgi:hypothetical protein
MKRNQHVSPNINAKNHLESTRKDCQIAKGQNDIPLNNEETTRSTYCLGNDAHPPNL